MIAFEEPTPLRDVGRRLHIGGRRAEAGWELFDIQPGPGVDHVGDCTDLGRFEAGSFAEVYASHVLEHLGYVDELPRALVGIRRILSADGVLRLSVPNFTLLCKLFTHADVSLEERVQIMRVAFGGQTDAYDFHKVGFSWDILVAFLRGAGFSRVARVKEHGLFVDASSLRLMGNFLSLNAEASP